MEGVHLDNGEDGQSFLSNQQIVYAYLKPGQGDLAGQDLEQLILERRGMLDWVVAEKFVLQFLIIWHLN